MKMHGSMSQGSVHNSWKLKNGLHTHPACHPLSMFGMLWIDVYDSVFQFPPISSNNQQPDQLYAKDKWCEHQTLTGFLTHAPYFYLRYLRPTDAYLLSQSCEID